MLLHVRRATLLSSYKMTGRMSISASCHPLAKRRDLIHCKISPAEPTASGALFAYVVQPLCLGRIFVNGEISDGGGELKDYVAPGAILFGAQELGAAANVASQILHRSVGEEAGQDVFNRLEISRREVSIEQEQN